MTTLLYRGNDYVQHKHPKQVEMVELKYRKNVYRKKISNISNETPSFVYRGNTYKK